MNIAAIQFPVFNPYKKAAIEIYVSGCHRRCKNCHNAELRDFNYGEPLNVAHLISFLEEREDLFEIISLMGGEPLAQNMEEFKFLMFLLKKVFPHKEFWLFTGNEKEQITEKWVFEIFDLIKTGPYIEKLKQEGFPASSNQKVWIKGKDY